MQISHQVRDLHLAEFAVKEYRWLLDWAGGIMVAVQGKEDFSKSELDRIADSLVTLETSSQNWSSLSLVHKPQRNAITGNYDGTVLMAALNSRGREVVWYDRRKGCARLDLAASQVGMLGIWLICSGTGWLGCGKEGIWWPFAMSMDSGTTWIVIFLLQSVSARAYKSWKGFWETCWKKAPKSSF